MSSELGYELLLEPQSVGALLVLTPTHGNIT